MINILYSHHLIEELKILKTSLDILKEDFNNNLNNILDQIHLIKSRADITDNEPMHDLTEACELYIERNEQRIDWLADNYGEMSSLQEICNAGSSINTGWNRGVEIILEDDFEEYIRERETERLDLKRVPDYLIINWKDTAECLKIDYARVEYQNEKYLIRRD